MFGIGTSELLVILLVALIVLGPKNLPKIANTLGKAMGEFRRASTEFQRTMNTELAFEEKKEQDKKQQAQAKYAEVKARTAPKDESATAETAATDDKDSGTQA